MEGGYKEQDVVVTEQAAEDFEYTGAVVVNFLCSAIAFALCKIFERYDLMFISVMWFIPAFGLLYHCFIDKVILKKSNTRHEIIEKQNVAYSNLLKGHTYLILAGVASAFVLYYTLIDGHSSASSDNEKLDRMQRDSTQQGLSDGRGQSFRWDTVRILELRVRSVPSTTQSRDSEAKVGLGSEHGNK